MEHVIVWIAVLLPVVLTESAQAGDLTIMFGRAQLTTALGKRCTTPPGAVDLWTAANELKARGLTATAPVTNSQIGTTTGICEAGSRYMTWSDLDVLRDSYGWSITPRGLTSGPLSTVTDPAVLTANVCGSRDVIESHGHMRAWGLFAWPKNRWTAAEEATYVPPCFAFGRRYVLETKSNPLPITGPYWWANVISVNGGPCLNPALPCHTLTVQFSRGYMQPSALAATAQKAYGAFWTAIQWYRFVSGKYGTLGTGYAWDCTSPDPADHWTGKAELYCYDDFLATLNGIDMTRLTVTDPAGVAEQQGLAPAKPVH